MMILLIHVRRTTPILYLFLPPAHSGSLTLALYAVFVTENNVPLNIMLVWPTK